MQVRKHKPGTTCQENYIRTGNILCLYVYLYRINEPENILTPIFDEVNYDHGYRYPRVAVTGSLHG